MRLLDKYIIKNFLINYLLAFSVLVGMYVLLDLIVNFDQFTRASATVHASGIGVVVTIFTEIANYYAYRMLVIFQQVCGAIPLLAAGFTMVRMTRNNELSAMLASGVSLYRVAVPIVICSIAFNLLVVLDQEVFMPQCVNQLLRSRGALSANIGQTQPLYFVPESDHSLVLASKYSPKKKELWNVRIIERNRQGKPIGRILAKKAIWQNHGGEGPVAGSWRMYDVVQINDQRKANPDDAPEVVSQMDYYTPLNPKQLKLIFQQKAVDFLSTAQIEHLIVNSPPSTRVALEEIMHVRFTQPIMNMLMLLLAIPFLLTREPSRLVGNMFRCTAVSAGCFIGTFILFQMAGTVVPPLLGAWLPVLLFGPLAVALLDTIKT